MKLYLSSYRVPTPDDLIALVGKPAKEIKMVIIPNANVYVERIRDIKVQQFVESCKEIGIENFNVVDLCVFDDPNKLKKELEKCDLIWVSGGNTFALRYEMRRSGFDEVIRELLDKGIVYGGESAGQLVAGPTLHGVEDADNPEYAEEIVWDGLGLVDEFIFPHADDPTYAEVIIKAKALHKDLIELKNSQAYIVNGENRRIVEGRK